LKDDKQEVAELRQRVNDLNRELQKMKDGKLRLEKVEDEKQEIEHALGERIKELNCMYTLSEIIEKHEGNFNIAFQKATELLPVSWQYPEITCGRIVFEGQEFKTSNYQPSRWKQKSTLYFHGEDVGFVEASYLKKMPTIVEGPFLREERLLIDAVAARIGRSVERIRAQAQLELEQQSIKNANIALKEVLARVQEEKIDVAESVQANVHKIVFPLIFDLESKLPPQHKNYLKLIKDNLSQIADPLTSKLAKDFLSLTPVEMRVCNMINNGLSSKEIAELRGVAPSTVNRQRENIRKKLGLTNTNINLNSLLASYLDNRT